MRQRHAVADAGVDAKLLTLAISRTTSSAANPVAAAASVESCSQRRPLSFALTSIMT